MLRYNRREEVGLPGGSLGSDALRGDLDFTQVPMYSFPSKSCVRPLCLGTMTDKVQIPMQERCGCRIAGSVVSIHHPTLSYSESVSTADSHLTEVMPFLG